MSKEGSGDGVNGCCRTPYRRVERNATAQNHMHLRYSEHAASVCAQPCPHLDAWAYAYADKERQELQDEVARLICETLRLAQLQVFSMGIMRVSRVVCASRHTEVVMIR